MNIPLETMLWSCIVIVSLIPVFLIIGFIINKTVDRKIKNYLDGYYIPIPEEFELPEFIDDQTNLYKCKNFIAKNKICDYNSDNN